MKLLKDFLGKLTQVDAPVAPDMTTIGLHIGEWIMVLGQFLSKGGIVLKEEVGVADTNPEELWLGSKQVCQLLVEVIIDLLVGATTSLFLAYGSREEPHITKGLRIVDGNIEGMESTH